MANGIEAQTALLSDPAPLHSPYARKRYIMNGRHNVSCCSMEGVCPLLLTLGHYGESQIYILRFAETYTYFSQRVNKHTFLP